MICGASYQVVTLVKPYFQTKRGVSASSGEDMEAGDAESALNGGEQKALLENTLKVITQAVGAYAGAVRLASPNGREMYIAGSTGLSGEVLEKDGLVDIACGVCGKALCESGTDFVSAVGQCALHSSSGGNKRVMAIPLGFCGNPAGMLNLFFREEDAIDAETMKLFPMFAELISVSLDNARLARENRRASLIAEREAISNEIHDSLAQTLVYMRMRMSVLQEALRKQDEALAGRCVADVTEALDNGQKAVRELITHFRCQMDPRGLLHALQTLSDEFEERTGIDFAYSCGVSECSIPLEHELQIFNIVREVLANIAVHSGASRASLNVVRRGGEYLLTVADNGRGISRTIPPAGHYGLTIMRDRASRIGARIELESAEGAGTKVFLSIRAV